MVRAALRAPFPWFGGKSRVAPLVWSRFGDVRNYVEAFAGSLAVLLARPGEPGIETVNDLDPNISNFWRAVRADPDEVARWADWPVNEADLHARHRWLVETAGEPEIDLQPSEREALAQLLGAERAAAVERLVERWDGSGFLERMKTDPEFYDAKRAGWWVWGQCLWIGSGWCAPPTWNGRGWGGRAQAAETVKKRLEEGKDGRDRRRPHLSGDGRGEGVIRQANAFGKLPAIAGRDGGRGAYAKSRSRSPEWEQRPHLGSDGKGQGVSRITEKRPALTGHGGGVGVHAPGLGKLPLIGGEAKGVHRKRPVLQQGEGGRGVLRLAHQVPDLSGDAGAAGRGIHASGFEEKSGGLQAYMRALSERLRRVRVCCGDFERILGPAVTTCIGLTGVLLDPPYDNDLRAICYNHDGPEAETGVSVWWRAYRWAIDHGGDPLLRIALCGYEHPDASFPPGWTCVAWKASGGYGRSERGKANARRERIWFSPHCLQAEQRHLFEPE